MVNFTQYIEDVFESSQITWVALADLTAASDTVQNNILLHKLYSVTKDPTSTDMVRTLLSYKISGGM